MTNDLKVIVEADCGNSPKKAQVRDWVVGLARGEIDEVCEAFSAGVTWAEAGSDTTSGIENVRARLTELARSEVSVIEIRHLLSHGKQVVASISMRSRRPASNVGPRPARTGCTACAITPQRYWPRELFDALQED